MTVQELIKALGNCSPVAQVFCGEEGRLAIRRTTDVHRLIDRSVVILTYSNHEEADAV